MNNNLIVCVTPLQVLIAEEIIKQHKGDKFFAVVLSYDQNKKYDYYISKLENASFRILTYYVKTNSKVNRFFEVIKFRRKYKRFSDIEFNKIFVASIENPFILSILSHSKFSILNTFDDGTVNINKNSIYYRDLHIGSLEKIVRRITGIKWNREDVKEKSELHYTLYRGFKNIINNVQVIDFFKSYDSYPLKEEELDDVREYNIFIGQPLNRIDSTIDDDFVLEIIKKYEIEYYFPHPRERSIIHDVEYIETHLVFEEYLLNFIKSNPNTIVNIYTFFSTAALNVVNFKNVCIYCIANDYMYNKYRSTYSLFEKSSNVKNIKLK